MSSAIEQQRQRVEQEITKMVDDMDKSFLRTMQVDSIKPPKAFLVKIIRVPKTFSIHIPNGLFTRESVQFRSELTP